LADFGLVLLGSTSALQLASSIERVPSGEEGWLIIYLRLGFDVGPGTVPDPVPMVSPVVPLLSAPLLMPLPALGRLGAVAAPPFWAGLAGETAASPVVVVEPVLAFCANAIDAEKSIKATATAADFIWYLQ
jgi:hypothetical protein